MLQFSELKAGMTIFRPIANYQNRESLYYTVEATGADWVLIRRTFNSQPMLVRSLLNWKLSKPRHKVYIRLMRDRNGNLRSISSPAGYDACSWVGYTEVSKVIVEVIEGDGLENVN